MPSRSQGSVRSVDPGAYRRTLRRFATGVTVMTTTVGAGLHGMTANAFASVSLDPPLILVCVAKDARMHGYVQEAGSFAVNVLAAGQRAVAEWFAKPGREASGDSQFEGLVWEPGPVLGHPVLPEALAFLECEVSAAHEAGDHSVVLGEVVGTQASSGDWPLAYYDGSYRQLDEAQPEG